VGLALILGATLAAPSAFNISAADKTMEGIFRQSGVPSLTYAIVKNGKVIKTETWGLRSLAYKIQKNRKAHFVLLDIEAPAGVVAELERQTAINEDIIRFMTVRVDEHEAGPSVMMRKNDRERTRRREREGE
jgi:small subunit ribosomal protein S6